MEKGRVTIPSESNFLAETKRLMALWGADAIRDSDGTKLDDELKQIGAKIYTTYFVARGHNDFAEKHLEEVQQAFLLSQRVTATKTTAVIPFMAGYLAEQLQPNYREDPKEFWEVYDRTLGEKVAPENWEVNQTENSVRLKKWHPYHEYTVSFLASMVWDPTQMYNHITNDWGDKSHEIPFDVRQPESQAFVSNFLTNWLAENPDTDVVRFTTFFYHFTLFFNDQKKEKFVDWFGYGSTVSVRALKAFEKEYGYKLSAENFVDEGYYNSTFRVPSQSYLDYIDFIQRFVAKEAKKLVAIVHGAGREAMMFLGDNWIGTEPYGPYFKEIGIDAVVGSVGNGTTLRMISEIPHVNYTEGRFLPYFFPDVFYEGNDPTVEAKQNWLTARRALLRKPVDRIGYGGYLSLANQFPGFVDYVSHVTQEFRELYGRISDTKPYVGITVGILNSWGKLRSWQTHMVAHALWYQQIYSYLGVLESLSGQKVAVEFLNFTDLKEGVPSEIDVLINVGDAGTAFSGGKNWSKTSLIETITQWVANGGGFIGIGEPTAYLANGRFFQLAHILGVDKELGFSLSTDKYFKTENTTHFITENKEAKDFGEMQKNIYALSKDTQILSYVDGSVQLATHDFFNGRGVYFSGLPYSPANAQIFLRSIYYAAHKEEQLKIWYADNPDIEVHAYPEKKQYAIVNNTDLPQTTRVYTATDNYNISLTPGAIEWRDYDE
ncbi:MULTISPECIES: 1,3-beta-galactosyl-N-acetylhexosamine phosphorylase [Enterococcus]|jgi:1,3-beta-galactosyl-N-acetylhexosamine phosphorylase|uniref:1,3-beta-galactosyl-N-acetylhexosamine phosphorylase n=1 Tax=Enterococcus dispar ATCC 51266 TaxID=1139219 RepID=S0KJM3_9ENTE|nr:1,3-beta-galactosyl-N-acetylhexosamine phosphorylase [Enterococcus dispar]EOT41190.1 1,3-beta-galactosyl-N-acetylhexosamine phosphorylase [Enterococcus dispar ATCC 51266]EOW87176.1 1,3-beta-galactosyl-N-acetylhexosamine phosphorylase [Enterococcus dispar ATCC 51266]MCU7356496.1 1,3-beta-galactosyl-N-acetylhexosamine phosphorylase [Enterococcus dispar]MDT2704464.1 1,3-beta-galactosyl-N-acetylhexosamine phosphorylase [Enterococcus dispar]OJG38661.1 1,3-beta-galactosyl-N-acetylhexosamine phosp